MRHRHKAGIALLAFSLCVIHIGGIFAYLTARDLAESGWSLGDCKIRIVEEFEPPEEFTAGTVINKRVSVQNAGEAVCYVRVKAAFSAGDMEGFCTLDWNTADYIYSAEDGYWYCTKALQPGCAAPELFTTVTVSDEAPEDQISDFEIYLYAEGCQAGGSGDYQEAWGSYLKNKPESEAADGGSA